MSKALESGIEVKTKEYGNCIAYTQDCIDIIERELKALEIIKNKKVNIYHIWVFDNYQQYKEHYPFSEYHAIEDMLTFEEFYFLKEVLENES